MLIAQVVPQLSRQSLSLFIHANPIRPHFAVVIDLEVVLSHQLLCLAARGGVGIWLALGLARLRRFRDGAHRAQLIHVCHACTALDALVADAGRIAKDAADDAAPLDQLPMPARHDQEHTIGRALLDCGLEPAG